MTNDIIQKPLVLSKQEVLMKLWEAREQLEAEMLEDQTRTEEMQRGTLNASQQQAPEQTASDDTHEEVRSAVNADVGAKKSATPEGTNAVVSETPDLMSPEVTSGLKRLLNEWPFFKKSGVLGFGPGGIEHPMYKKVADIPVRSVINGRWNEPDQELIEEVRDKVGGWRREQNIEPKEEETFEMYLRRVIATILNQRAVIEARTQK